MNESQGKGKFSLGQICDLSVKQVARERDEG